MLLRCVYIQIIEEVIHEEDEDSCDMDVRKGAIDVEPPRIREEGELRLPLQTYHHMIGRSFGVAFNDRSFLRSDAVGSGADRYYYGNLGTFSAWPTWTIAALTRSVYA